MAQQLSISVPADNDVVLQFATTKALAGCVVYWRLFAEFSGCVDPVSLPLLQKNSHSGGDVVVPNSPSPMLLYSVRIHRADTAALLRNYYYETTAVDGSGNLTTLHWGVMTVTQTENRIP
jgi:hypothetical protein